MTGTVIVEEHFALEATLQDSADFRIPGWDALRAGLLDLHGRRLEEMDENGIEMMLLSLNAPVIQAVPDPAAAADLARQANDYLAEEVARRSDRFAGLAALPMQDPDAAAAELERCVGKLGLKGALVNGFSQVGDAGAIAFYDEPQYRPFWQALSDLDVPFYLHPRGPLEDGPAHYRGHPWFTASAWGFAAETAIHALRLMACGLFDELPGLKLVIGHMGEHIPYDVWRIDHRIAKSPRGIPARRPFIDYLRKNLWITTSGNFNTRALQCALDAMGAERILFAVDYPFEEIAQGAGWFAGLELPPADLEKIGRGNANRLFRLGLDQA